MRAEQGRSSVAQAIGQAASALGETSDTPRLDAELLMAHALGMPREQLLLRHLGDPAPDAFAPLLARRLAHEPVAYITGGRGFWTIELEVGPGVLVPRPDSETLIETARSCFAGEAPHTILDLGTGPGTLLLAALTEWPQARGVGIDRSEAALGYARRNADRLGLAGRAELRRGDWAVGLEETFDLVLCNPPYVESGAALPGDVSDWEPPEALFAGPDGLDDYRRLATMIGPLLAPQGVACVEIGADQAASAAALFEAEGLAVWVATDLAGRPRCVAVAADMSERLFRLDFAPGIVT